MKGLVKVWVTTLPCRVLVKTKNVVIEEMRELVDRNLSLSQCHNEIRFSHLQ